jgi:hypothetical protein
MLHDQPPQNSFHHRGRSVNKYRNGNQERQCPEVNPDEDCAGWFLEWEFVEPVSDDTEDAYEIARLSYATPYTNGPATLWRARHRQYQYEDLWFICLACNERLVSGVTTMVYEDAI